MGGLPERGGVVLGKGPSPKVDSLSSQSVCLRQRVTHQGPWPVDIQYMERYQAGYTPEKTVRDYGARGNWVSLSSYYLLVI